MEKLSDPDYLQEMGHQKGDWHKAYHGSGFTELYSTTWNGQLKASCDDRIGENFGENPAIYCHGESDRTLEAMFQHMLIIKISQEKVTRSGHPFGKLL